MTQVLETLIAEIRTLPDDDQNALAAMLADDLADLRLLRERAGEFSAAAPKPDRIAQAEHDRVNLTQLLESINNLPSATTPN